MMCMIGILTIECRGNVPDSYVPLICAPFPELGHGNPIHAPTLVQLSPQRWGLRVLLRGVNYPLSTSTWITGIRSLEPAAFITGSDIQPAPPHLSWHYTLEPLPPVEDTQIYYYSGWTSVTLQVALNTSEVIDIRMGAYTQGRRPGETVWTAHLPTDRLGKNWGFLPHSGTEQWDRPPDGDMYRPLGTCIYLADGELFSEPPPERRSRPRIETIDLPAPAMEHTFVAHVVLPRNYDTLQCHYPVVFLNDGQNQLTHRGMLGGWHTDTIAAHLMRAGRMQDAVLVAVEMHPDRNRAYLPRGDALSPRGQSQVYTELLAEPFFDTLVSHYRLERGATTTAIIGSSNGAIHALFAGLTHPQDFGLIGSLSYAAMSPERNQDYITRLTRIPFQKIYLDSGTRWTEGEDNEDASDNSLITYVLRELLLQCGMVLEHNLLYLLAYGDAHNELAWRRRIAGCLEFLLPPL